MHIFDKRTGVFLSDYASVIIKQTVFLSGTYGGKRPPRSGLTSTATGSSQGTGTGMG